MPPSPREASKTLSLQKSELARIRVGVKKLEPTIAPAQIHSKTAVRDPKPKRLMMRWVDLILRPLQVRRKVK